MRRITSIEEMRAFARTLAAEGPLGLVPTMGALHEGHLSLIRRARIDCRSVVVSIFVNPAQFGPGEDLERYPRDIGRDLGLLLPCADAVFTPDAAEMYADGFQCFVDPGPLGTRLEGASRPGHFRGVATVVAKLFNIVSPHVAYFGQKDFQQTLIIRRLVRALNFAVHLMTCPVVREREGLALSSRNDYLSLEERGAALVLYRSLERASEIAARGEIESRQIISAMREVFSTEPLAKLDYAEIVDPAELRPVEQAVPGSVALVAAWIGRTRLIDNCILAPAGTSEEKRLELAFGSEGFKDSLPWFRRTPSPLSSLPRRAGGA
jgi:pantoate--beta-alanine ligase